MISPRPAIALLVRCEDISPLHFHVLRDQELHLRPAVSSTPAHFPVPASRADQGYK